MCYNKVADMKELDIISVSIGEPVSFGKTKNNSGFVEVDFDNGSVVLRATNNKKNAISAKDLKTVVK